MRKPPLPTVAALTVGVFAFMLAAGCGSSSTAATIGAPSPGPASPRSPVPRPSCTGAGDFPARAYRGPGRARR